MATKKTLKVELESWPIENLTPYDMNVKKHDKAQVTKIAASMARFGFDQPIVVDGNGVIIKGHGRRLAALELGLKVVPVWVRKDLSQEEVRAARLADNRVAQSDIDTDMLKIEISDLGDDLEGIFDDKELEYIGADLGEMSPGVFVTDMDAVLEDQRADVAERSERISGDDVRVLLSKAFGFKDVPAGAQIVIAKMMSKAEAATGLKDAEALVAFAATV